MSGPAQVHDVGYAAYDGERLGRAQAVWWLARWSALRALGKRRGWTAKITPIALAITAFLPGVSVLGVRALLADNFDINELPVDVLPYADYYGVIGVILVVWTAVLAPEFLCPDRRDRVLSLYYATATAPREYLLGKVLGTLAPLLFITLGPVLVLFAGNTLFANDAFGYLTDHLDELPRLIGGGVAISVYFTLLGLAVSSLTSRRAFAVGGFIALTLLSAFFAGALAYPLGGGQGFIALNLFTLATDFTRRILFGIDDGIPALPLILAYAGVLIGSTLILLSRYRRAGT